MASAESDLEVHRQVYINEQLVCHVCSKKYSCNDRLKAHLELAHDIRVSKQVTHFLCPFKCDQLAFQTMSVLLGYCAQHHESSLGKATTICMIISGYDH